MIARKLFRGTGRLLVAASAPTLQLEEFVGGISQKAWQGMLDNPLHPLVNKLVQGQYPPASTYKLVTAFAGKRARVVVMDANRADLGQLARWLGDKRLKPVIGHAFALDDSVSAHRLSESGRASGKIVIFPHAAADQAPASA